MKFQDILNKYNPKYPNYAKQVYDIICTLVDEEDQDEYFNIIQPTFEDDVVYEVDPCAYIINPSRINMNSLRVVIEESYDILITSWDYSEFCIPILPNIFNPIPEIFLDLKYSREYWQNESKYEDDEYNFYRCVEKTNISPDKFEPYRRFSNIFPLHKSLLY